MDFSTLSLEQKQQVETDVVRPAIQALESEIIGNHLFHLNCNGWGVVDESQIKNAPIPEGWDSRMRFNVIGSVGTRLMLNRVFPFKVCQVSGGLGAEANPEFSKSGIIVFARCQVFNGHERKVQRQTDVDRIHLFVTVKIPDESVFETGWFRLM